MFKKLVPVLVLLIVLLLPSVASAVSNPDGLNVDRLFVFRNVLTTGDQLWVVEYSVVYGSVPVEPASSTYLFSIISTDSTTLLFSRALNYYGKNLISIYLTPAQALTWGAGYYVRIAGNPAYFVLVEGTNQLTRLLVGTDYKEASELGAQMLVIANDLQTSWGTTLLTSNKLNSTGSTYFLEGVPNLNNMAPEIFAETTSYMSMGNASGNMSYGNTTKLGSGFVAMMSDLGSMMGVSTAWASFGFLGMGMLVVASLTYAATRQPIAGVVFGGAFMLIAGGWVGVITLQPVMVIVLVVAMLFGIAFILRRLA